MKIYEVLTLLLNLNLSYCFNSIKCIIYDLVYKVPFLKLRSIDALERNPEQLRILPRSPLIGVYTQ